MAETVKIPMFPLSIFPLPGEMVPLHIFEPRYRQLLQDAEERDISFGIFFNHVMNTGRLGSLVKLESVIKRYPTGESDIIVKCQDLFTMGKLFRTYKDKLYPGGEANFWGVQLHEPASDRLQDLFTAFLSNLKMGKHPVPVSIYHIALELNLDFEERMRLVTSDPDRQDSFLHARLKFQIDLLARAEKSRDVFHLN